MGFTKVVTSLLGHSALTWVTVFLGVTLFCDFKPPPRVSQSSGNTSTWKWPHLKCLSQQLPIRIHPYSDYSER